MKKILDLAKRMRAKRKAGSEPYVLVLGAGASVTSGTGLARTVVERVVGSDDMAAFDEYLSGCSSDERFAILRDLVEGSSPSPGYRDLAELIRVGYFDLIFSTNFDPLLENALSDSALRRRDYVLLVHGVMEPSFVADHLDNRVPRIKVLKLHGDLFYRKFYYTGDEIDEFPAPIQRALEIYLNHRDVVVVGHSMHDTDINRCLTEQGGSIWYVAPQPPTDDVAKIMEARKSEDLVVAGAYGSFDNFFGQLRGVLLGGTAEVSVDRIAQSIFAVARGGQSPLGSGFLLGDTGLLITDSSVLAGLAQGIDLGAMAEVRPFAGGPKYKAELVVAPIAALDFAAFRVANIHEVSPLELAAELPELGALVTACVSLGDSQGFHDGAVTGVDIGVPIQLGPHGSEVITELIETDIKIAPGACGSPLVGSDGRVVGVLVAGNGNRSFALTALRLRDMLAQAGVG